MSVSKRGSAQVVTRIKMYEMKMGFFTREFNAVLFGALALEGQPERI